VVPRYLAGDQAGLGPAVLVRFFYPGSPATPTLMKRDRATSHGGEWTYSVTWSSFGGPLFQWREIKLGCKCRGVHLPDPFWEWFTSNGLIALGATITDVEAAPAPWSAWAIASPSRRAREISDQQL